MTEDDDFHALTALEELLSASDEAREAVAGYMDEAYQRGVERGRREESERLSRIIDGITTRGT